jgi:hypothetical protein
MADTVQAHQVVGGATKRGNPDPDVKMPPAVKAAAERAEQLSAQAKEARARNAASGADQPVGASQTPPQTTPSQNTSLNGVMVTSFDPNNPKPPDLQTQPVSQTFQTSQAPQAPQTSEDWEHQFKSLKGRYDRDSEDKRRLQQQIVDMQRLMAYSGPAPANNPGEGSGVRFDLPKPPPPGRRVTAKEVQEYGEELLDVVGRRAVEVYEPLLNQLVNELNQVKRQVGGVQNTVVYDARVKMYDDLAKEVPNWDVINNSPQFAHWLDQIDPISRQARRSFLNAAHNSNQTGQVVDIFRGFLATQAPYASANGQGQPSGNVVTQQSNSPPPVDLSQFAAPGRAKSGQTSVPPEKPIFNAADIPQFYRDKTAGKYAGREAEADAIERALFEAGRDGRIIRR